MRLAMEPLPRTTCGKLLAAFGAGVVDGAFVAGQKDAAGLLVAAQDQPFFFALRDVIRHEARGLDVEISGEPLDVAFGHFGGGDAAAVGALRAIDLLFDAFGDAAQNAIRMIAIRLHVLAEALVLGALLFAEP